MNCMSVPVVSPPVEVRVVIFGLQSDRLSTLLLPYPPQQWQLPGRPHILGQSLEDTANASVCHAAGPLEIYLEQLFTYGDPARGGVSVVYFALLPTSAAHSEALQASGADWKPVDALPALAFDHASILTYALRRLRYKLEYTAVGFELLPETFTLTELQRTYELILGEKLDKRNFRRRILQAGVIEPTSHRRAGEGRPAQLFRYRPDAVAEVKARRLFP